MLQLTTIKSGMTNESHILIVGNKKYVIRIPGKGTEVLIDRHAEANTYKAIKYLRISDEVLFLDPKIGYKISKFIKNSVTLDPFDFDDVKKCMSVLKKIHTAKINVEKTFCPFERSVFYKNLCKKTKDQPPVHKLQKFLTPIESCLCHIDANHENFLFSKNKIKLIDWEYAAMADFHIDIAMFAIYAMYDRKQVDRLIEMYGVTNKYRVYLYISVCGLVWSNWCDYKFELGIDFGKYSLIQYNYAVDYYKIFMDEWGKDV